MKEEYHLGESLGISDREVSTVEVGLLRVIEKHQFLMSAVHKQIRLKEVARLWGLSPHYTKLPYCPARELRVAGEDFTCLLLQRRHPLWNGLPQEVRKQ